jgi:hypothetical protein
MIMINNQLPAINNLWNHKTCGTYFIKKSFGSFSGSMYQGDFSERRFSFRIFQFGEISHKLTNGTVGKRDKTQDND